MFIENKTDLINELKNSSIIRIVKGISVSDNEHKTGWICQFSLRIKFSSGVDFNFDIGTREVDRIPSREMYSASEWEKLLCEYIYDSEIAEKYADKLLPIAEIAKKYEFAITGKECIEFCDNYEIMKINYEKENNESDSIKQIFKNLDKANDFYKSGLITENEFEALKEKILQT